MSSESENAYRVHLTPYFRRIHNKDQYELRRWTEARDQVQHFDGRPIEAQVRKVRLAKLMRRIKASLRRIRTQGFGQRAARQKTADEVRRDFIIESRKLGNEYSESNRRLMSGSSPRAEQSLEETCREDGLHQKRIKYGNMCSLHNCEKLKARNSYPGCSRITLSSTTGVNRSVLTRLEFGRYYEARFKVNFKLRRRKIDAECLNLLDSCLAFERDHSAVQDGIGKFLHSNPSILLQVNEARSSVTNGVLPPPEKKVLFEDIDYALESETFQSMTTIRADAPHEPEVFLRSYRYTAPVDDHFQQSRAYPVSEASTSTLVPEEDEFETCKSAIVNFLETWKPTKIGLESPKKILSDFSFTCSQILWKDSNSDRDIQRVKPSASMLKLENALKNIDG